MNSFIYFYGLTGSEDEFIYNYNVYYFATQLTLEHSLPQLLGRIDIWFAFQNSIRLLFR